MILSFISFIFPHPPKSKIDNLKKTKNLSYYNEFGHAVFQSIFPHLQSSLQHWSVTTLVTGELFPLFQL